MSLLLASFALLAPLQGKGKEKVDAPPLDWKVATRKDVARVWKSDRPEDQAFVRALREPIDALERDLSRLREDLLAREYAVRFLGPEKKEDWTELYKSFKPYSAPKCADLRDLVPEARTAAIEMLHDPVFRCAGPLLEAGQQIAAVHRATLRMLDLFPDTRIGFGSGEVQEFFSRMALLAPLVAVAAADAQTLVGFSAESRAPKEATAQTFEAVKKGGMLGEGTLQPLVEEAGKKTALLEGSLRLPKALSDHEGDFEGLRQRLAEAEKRRQEALRFLPPEPGKKVPPPDPEVAKLRAHERWKASIDLLVQCVAKDPTSTWGLYDLARGYDFRKSVGDAISCFSRFQALYDPDGKKDDGFAKAVREYLDEHRRLGH
ncbi:MAG: hypothetical protein L0323_18865 [Planctomycetes bacterium]|nr:hypothetical protein [Planctomycetota bacterium]